MNRALALREVAALDLPHIVRRDLCSAIRPEFREVDPSVLAIDEIYQRNLSERSIMLIGKIVAGWDWARFKPPVVVETEGRLHVIDGQHTAIAAATHGGLGAIPVMVVAAPDLETRARAFVGHNRDRITVTGQQVHFALLAAGDAEAQTIHLVTRSAGVILLKCPPNKGVFKIGETLALATIAGLIKRRGPTKAQVVLQCLVDAECAPVGAQSIRAVAELLFAPEYQDLFDAARLTRAVRSLQGQIPPEAIQLASAKKLPLWRALVIVLANKRMSATNGALTVARPAVQREPPPPTDWNSIPSREAQLAVAYANGGRMAIVPGPGDPDWERSALAQRMREQGR